MMNCRHCGAPLQLSFLDLGTAPPSNAYITAGDLQKPESWFPLRVLTCTNCWLTQTEDFAAAEHLFDENYAYFSSFSTSWLEHSKSYAQQMTQRFGLTEASHVVEVAANDGYLLQYFQEMDIPCLGIEPTASTAAAARAKGIDIVQEFFGEGLASDLAAQGKQADLTAANNVLAHVPDINDFVKGFARLLKPQGVATFEFPHLLRLLESNQFDTIYHEHYSYLSLHAVSRIFEANGLNVFDCQELPTHGGSLRVFAQRSDIGAHAYSDEVQRILEQESVAGLLEENRYANFQETANRVKNDFLSFLIEAKRQGKRVAAYGAAAKGNTLLNYAGVKSDLIEFVVDRNPNKQGKFLPGSRIPIVAEDQLHKEKPDFVVILPWNLKSEIVQQLDYIRDWQGTFVTAIPQLAVL